MKNLFQIFFCSIILIASASTVKANTYRISILTCAQGEDLYATFGHSAIRVTDSVHHSDIVYNYGTFNFNDPDFYVKFVKGNLLYFIEACDYNSFLMLYAYEHRSVSEQVLALDSIQQSQVVSYLNENLLEQYKYYKYDFVNDNCATRVYQVFNQLFENQIDCNNKLIDKTHRSILNEMLTQQDWTRLGINLMLGKRVDQPINTMQSFFIPKYLELGLQSTSLNQKKLVLSEQNVLHFDEYSNSESHLNQPLVLLFCLLIIMICCNYIEKLNLAYKIMSSVYLIISSFLGIVFLTMWFWSSHAAMHENYNVLWALPTNFWIVLKPKNKNKYFVLTLILIACSFLLHILGVQRLPIEIIPFILGLLFIYISKLKKNAQ
jgi:hypothetical protein